MSCTAGDVGTQPLVLGMTVTKLPLPSGQRGRPEDVCLVKAPKLGPYLDPCNSFRRWKPLSVLPLGGLLPAFDHSAVVGEWEGTEGAPSKSNRTALGVCPEGVVKIPAPVKVRGKMEVNCGNVCVTCGEAVCMTENSVSPGRLGFVFPQEEGKSKAMESQSAGCGACQSGPKSLFCLGAM